MRKRLAIFTSTRAEYGLLKTLYFSLLKVPEFEVSFLVSGAHLSREHGYTYEEIKKDGVRTAALIPVKIRSRDACSISRTMADTLSSFADHFRIFDYDLLFVLGDRYETLSVCIAAMNQRIPIAHLHGGETTEGAVDEAIRHSITKMSYLHFTAMEQYRKRVIQLGESPDRVFNVGALGVENILSRTLLTKEELEKSISFALDKPYAVVTYHPVTLEEKTGQGMNELFGALDAFPELKFIVTGANADAGGERVNALWEEYAGQRQNVLFTDSLGALRYLSALRYCEMVIGNSSSGIIEAPSFGIPTVNIGDRQKGRIQADSVLNTAENIEEIRRGICLALSEDMKKKAAGTVNPYGDGKTSEKITQILQREWNQRTIDLKKKFYDLTGE